MTGQNLIIIDREVVIAVDIKLQLEKYYNNVQIYSSGEQALKKIDPKKNYTIIITEGLDGHLSMEETITLLNKKGIKNILINSSSNSKKDFENLTDSIIGVISKASLQGDNIPKYLLDKKIISDPSEKLADYTGL